MGLPIHQVYINDQAFSLSSAGEFSATLPLDSQRAVNPFLAELRNSQGGTLSLDRIVVLAGSSVKDGQYSPAAAGTSITDRGYQQIQPQLDQMLIDSGILDLNAFILDQNPLFEVYEDDYYLVITGTAAGFACHSIELDSQAGQLASQALVYDIFVNYHARGGTSIGPIHIDIDCDGTLTTQLAIMTTALEFDPTTPEPGREINVIQNSPVQIYLTPFYNTFWDGPCDWPFLDEILNNILIPWTYSSVFEELDRALNGEDLQPGEDPPLAEFLESVLADLDLDDLAGNTLDAEVDSVFTTLAEEEEGSQIGLDLRVQVRNAHPLAPDLEASYHREQPLPDVRTYTPTGQPFGASVSMSTSAINQFLKAETEAGLLFLELDQLDMGNGEEDLTAGMLGQYLTGMDALAPHVPLVVRTRPTLAPLVLGQSGPFGELANIEISHLLIELALDVAGVPDKVYLTASVDFSLGTNLYFSSTGEDLQWDISEPGEIQLNVVVYDNALGIPPLEIPNLLLASIKAALPSLEQSMDTMPLPEFLGIRLQGLEIERDGEVLNAYFNLEATNGRPDLIVSNIDAPAIVDRNLPFDFNFTLTNIGTVPAIGLIDIGAQISPDEIPFNPFDIGIGQYKYDLGPDGLAPNESRTFSMRTLSFPMAEMKTQNLFVCADLIPFPFSSPTAGILCEGSENNNCSWTPIEISAPDAFVNNVTSPEGLLAIPSPGEYLVEVGRNSIGPEVLRVPVTVTVGNPTLFWQTVEVDLTPGERKTISVFVGTPLSHGTCGDTFTYEVIACTNLFDDSNRDNDCFQTTVDVTDPYWDLRYEIVNAPDCIGVNDTMGWEVRVTNAGNQPSMFVCSKSALSLTPDNSPVWSDTVGIHFFTVPVLNPGQSYTHVITNYWVGPGTILGPQFIKAGVDYGAGCFDNCSTGNEIAVPVQIKGPDIAVIDIQMDSCLVGGQSNSFTVELKNEGLADAPNFQVELVVGNLPPIYAAASVAAGATTFVNMVSHAPAGAGTCGSKAPVNVRAKALNSPDANFGNNERQETGQVSDPYWDLHYDIIASYSIVDRNTFIEWQVRVTNVGTMPSMLVCSKTALSLSCSNSNVWGDTAGINFFTVPPLQPGGTWTWPVNNYWIGQGTYTQIQYIKAGVDYGSGCFDDCNSANLDCHPVEVR